MAATWFSAAVQMRAKGARINQTAHNLLYMRALASSCIVEMIINHAHIYTIQQVPHPPAHSSVHKVWNSKRADLDFDLENQTLFTGLNFLDFVFGLLTSKKVWSTLRTSLRL